MSTCQLYKGVEISGLEPRKNWLEDMTCRSTRCSLVPMIVLCDLELCDLCVVQQG